MILWDEDLAAFGRQEASCSDKIPFWGLNIGHSFSVAKSEA